MKTVCMQCLNFKIYRNLHIVFTNFKIIIIKELSSNCLQKSVVKTVHQLYLSLKAGCLRGLYGIWIFQCVIYSKNLEQHFIAYHRHSE